ncbi:MAG: hypothetical protein ACRCYY_03340 [Trueperaceae bacterium]
MWKKATFIFTSTSVIMFALIYTLIYAQVIPGITPNLEIKSASATYLPELDLLVLEQEVADSAGNTKPAATGQLDGAGVIGYAFPTNLTPADAGFGNVEGTLAIAVTSHTDFDDTPYFDENNDGDYNNDGENWHSHLVVLAGDERASGGLSVKQFAEDDASVIMPPTNPGLPMYLDSPGFPVVIKDNKLKVLVSTQRLNTKTTFKYDAVTAYMQVNTSDNAKPLLGVYEAYNVLSGDLSLPYKVKE